MSQDIVDALAELEMENDDQWTAEGDPKLDVVSQLAGRKVTRKEVKEAAPHFSRENPELASVLNDEGEANAEGQEEGEGLRRAQEVTAATEAETPTKIADLDLHLDEGADPALEKEKPESQQLDEAAQRIQHKMDQLAKERNRLHALASQAHQRETRNRDRHQGTKDRMAYIRAQTEQRAKKVQQGADIAALLGVQTPGGSVPTSQLDAALRQRKAELGKTRPDHTPMAKERISSKSPQHSPALGRNPGAN